MRQYLSVAAVGFLQRPLPSRGGVLAARRHGGVLAASRSSSSPVARRRGGGVAASRSSSSSPAARRRGGVPAASRSSSPAARRCGGPTALFGLPQRGRKGHVWPPAGAARRSSLLHRRPRARDWGGDARASAGVGLRPLCFYLRSPPVSHCFACRWAQKKETLDLFSRAEMQRMAPFDTGEQCHPIWIRS